MSANPDRDIRMAIRDLAVLQFGARHVPEPPGTHELPTIDDPAAGVRAADEAIRIAQDEHDYWAARVQGAGDR